MFNFFGKGSALNPILGNTSAFIKKGRTLFMIDCGENVFTRLIEWKQLDGIDHIVVAVTHTHPDHVGSLGSLIFHGYYDMGEMFKPKVTVVANPAIDIISHLRSVGVPRNTYNLIDLLGSQVISVKNINMRIEPILVDHVQELYTFGFLIRYDGYTIWYSGDCNMIPDIILNDFKAGKIDYLYQDTSGADYPGNAHLSLSKLAGYIPIELRNRVYCMHLDRNFPYGEVYNMGFKLVRTFMEG